MAEAAVRHSTLDAPVHLPLTDIPAFVAEMEAFGFYYFARIENGKVVGLYRSEPADEPEDVDTVNDLLWRLRATANWKRRIGEFCVKTGRVWTC